MSRQTHLSDASVLALFHDACQDHTGRTRRGRTRPLDLRSARPLRSYFNGRSTTPTSRRHSTRNHGRRDPISGVAASVVSTARRSDCRCANSCDCSHMVYVSIGTLGFSRRDRSDPHHDNPCLSHGRHPGRIPTPHAPTGHHEDLGPAAFPADGRGHESPS